MSVAREEPLHIIVPEDHLVQLYAADTNMLAFKVGAYIFEGWQSGIPALVIAGEKNRDRILAQLKSQGTNTNDVLADGSLQVLNAQETLARFMVNGFPDARLFDTVVGNLVRSTLARGAGLRAYGDMAGVLWSAGEAPAAIRLEQLWNKLRADFPFGLFCGYAIDIFSEAFEATSVNALLCAHTHLLPTGSADDLSAAVSRAMDDVLGPQNNQGHPLFAPFNECAQLPKGEAMILWVRLNLPAKASEILELARRYYYDSSPA
ncbi:MAG: MEDS domain-containing protein [Candidatus Baltobacteraceae bacterium]